ncbi:LysR family transcriptional regulator [Undibacterium arcticum]|uniref:helix-turn-helix domain-containing protein n=1 Tax=Undibacterium arcticum TaxID=1762892 RepID=UPI00361FA616
MDILHLDLKLLVAFEAMLATRNVTSAADAIGLTQPAMSTCLGKLRKVLGDPLSSGLPAAWSRPRSRSNCRNRYEMRFT